MTVALCSAGLRRRTIIAGGIALTVSVPSLSGASSARPRGQSTVEAPSMALSDTVRVTKRSEQEIVLEVTFAQARAVLFQAITRPEHLKQWMSAGGMSLTEVAMDARVGGAFRYVFQRPNGARIEVRGEFKVFDPPRAFAYLESYDFSPLKINVSTTLEEVRGGTLLIQTLRYFSTRERDEDFDGVATSSREAYAKLARYLGTGAVQG